MACLSRTNQQTARMFLEGAVASLTQQVRRVPREEEEESEEALLYMREVARFALANQGINVDLPKRQESEREQERNVGTREPEGEGNELLHAIGLDTPEIAEIFKKHQIDREGIKLLRDKDLVAMGIEAMGPRKKILYYGKSLRRAQKPAEKMNRLKRKRSKDEPQNHCLVCFDQGNLFLAIFLVTYALCRKGGLSGPLWACGNLRNVR